MGEFGWHNPFPRELGGGPTLVAVTYAALRSNVGVGGSALDDANTIDGVWRQARASALAAARASAERSVLQAFPGHATDLLPYYEDLFALVPEDAENHVQRRSAAELRYVAEVDASGPGITAALQQIDDRFSIVETDHVDAVETMFGRGFEEYTPALPFGGGRKSTRFHNYSTDFVLWVLLDIGNGSLPDDSDEAVLRLGVEHLNTALPSWVLFRTTTAVGFIVGQSRIGYTALFT